MSVNPSDKGLLTPENCAVIFIDHQPQMFLGVATIDRQVLLNNLLVLAKAARIFGVPVVLTAIDSKEFKGDLFPELLELFPEETPIERSTMNSWDSADFVAAVKKTGRRNLVIAALWTEVCLAMPALQALTDGYFVYAVEDASGGMSLLAHRAALRRIEQAGAVSVTALQVLLEFQRDWARNEHYDEVMATLKAHCSICGPDAEHTIINCAKELAAFMAPTATILNHHDQNLKKSETMSQYHKLYTPEDSAVVFIDHQPQMTFGVASIERASLINNVTLLAKVAKEFGVPAVLTAVETESFSGYVWPQLLDVFPGQPVVERTSMNSWDDPGFRAAIEATGKKNILMTGLWTEVCVTWPTIEMLGAGYNIYVVEDCCGATSPAAQEAALSRMVQAGAVRLTTIPALLEWQRDWASKEHYNNLMGLLKQQAGAYGVGVEYAYTMVHHAPQSAVKPQLVPKKIAH